MRDWNVVATAQTHHYNQARELLEDFGRVWRTEYFNVLTLKVEDIPSFMASLNTLIMEDATLMDALARVIPLSSTFDFQTPDEFESKAKEALSAWLPQLSGRRFHVRMHRRGFKKSLSSQAEERFLDDYALERLATQGETASIGFDDPDIIIALETVSQRAGLSLWTREDLQRYSFLKLD